MKNFVLALDIGTSSVRSAVFDTRGRRLEGSLVQRSYELGTGPDGRATLDPKVLLREAGLCLQGARGHLPGGSREIGVGVTCFWHSLLGVDASGRPLTPVITWADSRCRDHAAELRTILNERKVHLETGCMLRASFWPAKLRWLRASAPALFKNVTYWISPAEWIQWKLTGVRQCAPGMATGTGLFDPSREAWSARMLEVAGIREPQLFPVGEEAMGASRVFPAIGDGAASNLGSQCEEGSSGGAWGAVNVGTSAALRVIRVGRKVRAPFGLFGYRIDSTRYLVGGAVSNAGNLRAWCLQQLRLNDSYDILESELRKNPSAGKHLTVLPYWTAERAPDWNEDSTGVISGLTQSTSAIDLLAAITEASYLRMAAIAKKMPDAKNIRWLVSGGILRSDRALKRLAAALGSPIYKSPEPEASLRGAAVYALDKLGIPADRLRPGRALVPPSGWIEAARESRQRMKALGARLGD